MKTTNPNLVRTRCKFLDALNEKSLTAGARELRELAKAVHAFRFFLDDFEEVKPAATNRKIWIVRPDALHSDYFATLSSGDFDLKCFNSPRAADVALRKDRPAVILVSMEFESWIQILHDEHSQIHLVLLSKDDIAASIHFLQERPKLQHLIFDHAMESLFMQRNLLATCEKLVNEDLFGLEKHLDYGSQVIDAIISGNESRAKALEQLDADLLRAGLSQVFMRKAHHLADELLMNAIYDAPVDILTQKPRYNHLTRSVAVELDPTEYARLRYGFDGSVLAISITDPFGALPRDIILKYLKSCFEGQFGKLNEKEGKGGGGMGLYQILSSADLFLANVIPGEKTEVIVLLNVHERLPPRAHSFHYFTRESGVACSNEDLTSIVREIELLAKGGNQSTIPRILELKAKVEMETKDFVAAEKEQSLLLLSPNKRYERTVKAVLGLSEFKLHFHENLADIKADLAPDILAVDDTICDAIDNLLSLSDRAKCVAFSDRKVEMAFANLQNHPLLEQVFSLDLPKIVLHKLMLNHFQRLLRNEGFGISTYMSFGAKVKPLASESLQSLPRSKEEKERWRELERAFADLIVADKRTFAFDSHVFALSITWQEQKTRSEWLKFFHPDSKLPSIAKLYEQAHALVFASDGHRNELTALRFLGSEEISEPFLYTFFVT